MDHHSTHLQFNQRTPKSGPFSLMTRFTEQPPKISIEKYAKSPSPAKSTTPHDDTDLSLAQRPIATNSRVRQGEQLKRDMFISFINKALQEKLNVRLVVCSTRRADFIFFCRARAKILTISSTNSTHEKYPKAQRHLSYDYGSSRSRMYSPGWRSATHPWSRPW